MVKEYEELYDKSLGHRRKGGSRQRRAQYKNTPHPVAERNFEKNSTTSGQRNRCSRRLRSNVHRHFVIPVISLISMRRTRVAHVPTVRHHRFSVS